MTQTLAEFRTIRDAEAYFEFFGLNYDPQILNVNRLHILRKFSEAMQAVDATPEPLEDQERLARYREGLAAAYTLFLTSNSLEQKLFKVFQQPHDDVVLVEDIT
jgi:nitrogenase-stabilizing/protective protein